jgi:alpha-ribazole phosphatase
MRTSIWLVRHGQTALNKERRYQGATDSPLTPYGQRQAEALARRLRRIPFGVAVVGPHLRTRATAATILQGRDIPIVEDARWSEVDHGRWEGLTYAEVAERFPAEAAARFADALHGRPTDGESLAEVAQRVEAGWQALLQQYDGGRVLVVTSATPVQILLCLVCAMPVEQIWRWRVDLGGVTTLDVYGGAVITRMVNEVPRLGAR